MDVATSESLIIALQAIQASIQAHDTFCKEVAFTLSSQDPVSEAGKALVAANDHAMGAIQDAVSDLQASISKGGLS